jgi:NitT/TauT family transport system substrate-binding protein
MNDRRTRREAVAALAAVSASAARPLGAQPEPIRVGYAPTDTFAESVYAEAAGFFRRAGLNVKLVMLPTSSAMATGIVSNSIDIGAINAIAVANARQQGIPFYAIGCEALFAASEPTTLLMVPIASAIHTPKDLEGKTIATIELRGIMQAGIRSWMLKAGADPTNQRFIELPFSVMANACTQGRVDAAMIAEPALYASRTVLRDVGSPYAAIANEWALNLWVGSRDWIARNTATAHTFATVMSQTAAWALTHRAETLPMLQKVLPLSEETATKMTRARFAEKLTVALMQPVLDTAAANGILKTPMNAAELIMPGFG